MNKTTNSKTHKNILSLFVRLSALALFVTSMTLSTSAQTQTLTSSGTWSGTMDFRNYAVRNGDVFKIDASPSGQQTNFLLRAPDRDFTQLTMVSNYPSLADYQLFYMDHPYAWTPDRPSWLASSISTWASPVIIKASGTTGTLTMAGTGTTTLSIMSSDAYDADGKLRLDKDNIAWAVLKFDGLYADTNRPFIYLNAPGDNSVNKEITINVEHVIFYGSKNPTNGSAGGLINNASNANRTTRFVGDVGFVGNMSNTNGGVLYSTGNVVFDGNVFFDGNMTGIGVPSDALKGVMTSQGLDVPAYGLIRPDSAAGIVRMNTANTTLTFKKTALFTNNASGGEAGALMVGNVNNVKIAFEGNAAFFGNQAGLIGKIGATPQAPGRGGAIGFLHVSAATGEVTFQKEAIFISNRATAQGGAISAAHTTDFTGVSNSSNVTINFQGISIFTDNMAGRENEWERVITYATEDLAYLVGQDAKLNSLVGDGGVIAQYGSTEDNKLRFLGDTEFARNRALGNGGALSNTGGAGSIIFSNNVSFTDNVAGSLYRTFSGTTGTPVLNRTQGGGAIYSRVKVAFSGTDSYLVADGNMSYYQATEAVTGSAAPTFAPIKGGDGGAFYSYGNSGLYIDQEYAFTRNQAGGNGGAIYAIGTASGTLFAGAVRNYSLEITKGGSFVENVASGTGYGGAIFAHKALITSGALFENNAAGGYGGAIYMATLTSGTNKIAPRLTLKAETDDIIFTGNRSEVTTDESNVDPALVTSQTSTGGRIAVVAGTGIKNDIYIHTSGTSATPAVTGTLELAANAGRKIYFDGGIMQSASAETGLGLLAVTKTGAGMVEFDGANADINAVTTVKEGTLRVRGGTYGLSGATDGTKFDLQSNATLEANGLVQSATISIGSGATLRVLNGGALKFNSANAIGYGTSVNLAGSGTIFTGATAQLTASSLGVGDSGHTLAQKLTLLNATNQGLGVALNGSALSFGLFSGGADSIKLGSLDLGTTTNRIDLTSLANGTFILIAADSAIANNTTGFDIYYKGEKLNPTGRLNISASAAGQNVTLNYNATNAAITWNGAAGDSWNISDTKWTGASDSKFLYGDIVKFDATKNGNIAINSDMAASGITVSNNYTFTGSAGIETNAQLWGGSANASANGLLIKDGAANTTLTLANATGTNAANKFAGIDIKAGTVAAGNAAQLGTSLSNITFSGAAADTATLKITGTMALSGKNGNQRLNVSDGKTGNLSVDAAAILMVTDNETGAANGGALHIGSNATLNIAADGDIIFSGNSSNAGGGAYLETGATMNLAVAEGKKISFGNLNPDAAILNPALVKADTLASADTTAIINKTGAGTVLINGDNSAFAGKFNINSGSVWMNPTSTLGGDVTLNNNNSLLAATTLTGNLTANAGTKIQIGNELSYIPQVLRVGGTLAMNNASLVIDGFAGSLIYRDVFTDTVETSALHMTGTNAFDVNFALLSSGVYRVLSLPTADSFKDASGNYTIPIKTVVTGIWSETTAVSGTNLNTGQTGTFYIVSSNTTFKRNVDDLVLTSGGVSIAGKRFSGDVSIDGQMLAVNTMVYDAEGTALTGTSVFLSGSIIGGGTLATTIENGISHTIEVYGNSLMLNVQVQNIRSRWTGSVSAAWNANDANWVDLVDNADNRFVAADGIHFDSVNDAGFEANREIAITKGGVLVGEMIVSGTANYTFTEGKIAGEASRSNLAHPNLATGALEMNGTGVLTLDNDGNKFSGGIIINSGTVIGKAASLNENNITIAENTGLVYKQETDATMVGSIYGPGTVYKTGTGALTLASMNQAAVGHVIVEQGRLVVSASNALYVAGMLGVGPEAGLVFSTTLNVGTLVNYGTIQRTTGTASSTVGQMPLLGDFVAAPGSTVVLNLLRNGLGVDSLIINGDASGSTKVLLNVSGTHANVVKPEAKRDVRLIAATGVNQLQIENSLGVNFYDSGTAGIGTEYAFIQARDGTLFLRNQNATPVDVNMPMIGASPLVSDLIGQAVNNAMTERINARHETASKGLTLWTNYANSQDHLREGFYHDTDLKSNIAQVGGEYTFASAEDARYGQLTAGIAYAYASGKATRANQSTLDVESHTLNAYAGYRKEVFYANAIVSYSPSSDYEAVTTDILDSNGTVKGQRLSASLELGGIFALEGGGQLEPYVQALWQQNSFDDISRPTQDYSFNDPTSSNGRGYSFSNYSTTRGLAGVRWSARFDATEKFALKPWVGAGLGFAMRDTYDIIIGSQTVKKDLGGEYYKFSGGLSFLWTAGFEVYATGQYTQGSSVSNLTLLGGINYRW